MIVFGFTTTRNQLHPSRLEPAPTVVSALSIDTMELATQALQGVSQTRLNRL